MANIVELREMTNEKLEEMLENSREEMFNLRFQHAAARVPDTNRIRTVRRELAQLQAVLHKRTLAIEAAATHPQIASALSGKEYDATARFVYEDNGFAVAFAQDGAEIATALVDLNKKRPEGRRERAAKTMPQLVVSHEIK